MTERAPAVMRASLLGLCPRCGRGPLFVGVLKVAARCSACGLDYSGFDVGDGPAVFAIFIVGFIAAGGALFVEFNYAPPYWVHAVLWVPLILVLSLVMLRLLKGILLVLQYRHDAAEGRLAD